MRTFFLIACTFCILSCSSDQEQQAETKILADSIQTAPASDTIIGSKEITDELPGRNYRKRAKGYFLMVKNDTSGFMPVFIEMLEDGKIVLDLRFQKNKSYKEQYKELQKIIPSASKDFNFDSLQSIAIGRLITTGDLAIDISLQANENKELNKKSPDYSKVSSFLTESKLSEDFNSLFNPYGLKVSGVSVEKVFFTSSSDLKNQSRIETDSSQIPEKLLDCQTWIKLTKK